MLHEKASKEIHPKSFKNLEVINCNEVSRRWCLEFETVNNFSSTSSFLSGELSTTVAAFVSVA
jgi:hypothetical protein